MSRRAGLVVVAVLGVAVVVPSVGAAPAAIGPLKSLLSDEGRQQAQDALERSRAAGRAQARRPRVDRRRFAGLSATEALRTATDEHPGLFAARPTRLLALRPGERVERYLGDHAARLDVPGRADAIINSDLPLRVDVDGEKRPVDLVLVDRGDHLAPAVALVPATFPDALGDPLTVGDEITMRLLGADPATAGEQAGQQVFYANALRDADLLATPLATGLETFVQLRSADSPRQLPFEFGLPAGARLEAEMQAGRPTGGVSIVRGSETIGRVHPPTASDANGAPVEIATDVVGRTLTLSVDADADAAYPVLVDPIVEVQAANLNDVNAGFTNTRGWRRDSSVGVAAFNFVPNADSPGGDGTGCVRIRNDGTLEVLNHAICVGTFPTLNYPISATFQSIGAWTWRPPAGVRSSVNDVPVANTDAFVYRADIRTGYVDFARAGGNTAMVAGLISGRTHTWIGTYGVTFAGTPPQPPPNGVGGNSPFLLDFSQSSFFGTYCARSDCSAELNDPVYDGTYMAFGVWAAGTGQQASAIGQGAVLAQSDRSAPLVAHVPVSDDGRWYNGGTFTSRATASDAGMGMQRMGVLFDRRPPMLPYTDEVQTGCQGSSASPCPTTIAARNFTYDVAPMPEGRNTVFGVGVDILGRATSVPMTTDGIPGSPQVQVKVDTSVPTVSPLTGTLADKSGRAVKDGTYQLTASVTDGADRSGVKTITFKRADNSVIQSFAITCNGADCPATASATLNFNTAAPLPAGPQTIKVIAEDSAGNVIADASARSVTFVVDHAPPTITTLTHTPALAGWFGDRTMTATATATDDASGVKRFTLTTPTSDGSTTSTDTVVSGCDDTIANLCSSPVTRALEYSTAAMGDGAGRPVSLTATDALDQTSAPPRAWTVGVDTAGPQLTLSGPAWDARDGYVGDGPVELQAAAVDSVGGQQRSGVARITMRIDHPPPADPIDDSVEQVCTTSASQACDLSGSLTIPAGLADGEHTVYVSATDNADPANTTTTSFAFLVDKTAPTITDLQHTPAAFSQWRDDVPRSVDVTAHDDLSGVAQFTMTLPLNPPGSTSPNPPAIAPFDVTCTGPAASPCPRDATGALSYPTGDLEQGVREPSVVATDRAGNTSAASPWTLKLDRTPPTAVYSGSIAQGNGGTLLGGSMDLRVDASDGFSGVQEIRFLVDGEERQSKQGVCDDGGCAASLSDTFVMNASSYATGPHTVRVEVSDRVGTPQARHVTVKEYTVTNVAGSASSPRQALGLEDFWQYDSTPTGAGSAAHANLATGNLVWHKVPIVNRGRGLSSVVNVTYNSHDTTALLENLPVNLRYQEVGRGFSLAISGLTRLNEPLAGVSVAGLPTVPSQIGLSDADGTRHTFGRIGATAQYSHPPGVNLRLRQFTAPPLIALPGANTSKTWAITRPDGTTFYYDANGYERSITDRNGNTITFEYEIYLPPTGTVVGACPLLVLMDGIACAQRVRRVIDAGGRAIEISYRSGAKRAGMIDKIVDHRFLTPGSRRATRFIYDANGYVKEIAEALTEGLAATPETRITKFEYTANAGSSDQQLRQIIDPLGQATNIEYAAPNPAIQLIAGGGPPVRSITNRRAKTTGYALGFFTDATRTRVTDALARPTRYTLDVASRPTEKVDARSTTTKLVWDANHNVQQLTMAAGSSDEAVTNMTYNPNGMLLTRTDPESTDANPKILTLTYRDGPGTQTTAADSGGVFVSDLTSITSPEINATTFGLDARGNTTSRTDAENNTASTTFDASGQIQTETDEVGNITRYEQYDPNGLPQQVVSPRGVAGDPDANGGRWIYRYDTVGNVLSVTDPRAGAAATVANPGTAFTTTIAYDALDRPTKTTSPKDSPSSDDTAPTPDPTMLVRDTVYDVNDNVTKRIDAERKEATATFTPMDQVETVSSPGVPHGASGAVSPETSRYFYDDVDNVRRMDTPRGESTTTEGDFRTEYRYSPVDEKVAEIRFSTELTDPTTLASSWAYDRRGNQIAVVDPRQNARYKSATPQENAQIPSRRRFTYEYDKSDNRLVQIEDPGGENDRTQWRYDRNDRMVAKVDPRGNETGNTPEDFTWRYGYDTRDLLTSVESPAVGHTGEANAARRRTEYERRADGKIVGVTTPRGTQTSGDPSDFKTELAYDADGALKSRTLPRAPGQYGPQLKVTWERDPVGNPIAIRDARRHRFTNAFYDTGALKSTTRPSWWTVDEQAMTIRERTLEQITQANSAGDTPREQSAVAKTDFGDVKAEAMPDWMPKSGKTTFGYDAEMRLTRVTDVASMASTIVRDALGRTQNTTRPFDQDGLAPVLPETISNSFTYDFNGNLLSETDGEQKITRYNYDQFDRRIRQTAPGSSTAQEITNYTLDHNGNLTDVVTPRGTTYESGFDRLDRLTSSTNPEGDKTTFDYDAAANKVEQTQPRGNVGGVSDAQRAKHTTTWTYNRAGDMSAMTTGLGDTTAYGYDRNANQVRVAAPGAASSEATENVIDDQILTRTFDGRDLPWATTTGTGTSARTTISEFDGNANPRRQVNPRGVDSGGVLYGDDYSASATDDFAAVSESTDATRHATVREFSDDDLLRSIHQPWGPGDGANGTPQRERFRMNFGLDARGRVSTIDAPYEWSQDHAKAQRTKYGHFDNGWVQSVSDERVKNPTVASDPTVFVPDHQHDYVYDRRGLQTDWISDKGRRIKRVFYDNGLLESRSARKSATDTTSRDYSYEYNPNGSLTKLTDPSLDGGRVTSVTYDDADRALRINETWNGGRDSAYTYDPDGNIDNRKVDGRILPETQGGAYDGGRTTQFEFDELGREQLMRVVAPGSTADRVTNTTYWPSGQIHDRDKALGATDSTYFDSAGRLSQMVRRNQAGSEVKDQAYTYDENANRSRDERGSHEFNARDQLTRWTRGPNRPDTGSVVEYELNASGAILKKTDAAASPQITTYEYNEDPAPGTRFIGDRLIRTVQGSQATTYDYNALGDITRIDVPSGVDTTFGYDDFERRETTTGPGGNETYTYDALDRRDKTTKAGKTFDHSYVGLTEKLSREQTTAGGGESRTFDYDSALRRQGQTATAGTYRSYALDANGSVEGLETGGGNLENANSYVYDPYGELEDQTLSPQAGDAPFRFQGHYSDSAVNTYDMQARSYRPDIGRFLSQDRYEGATADVALQSDPLTNNRYAFLAGNPVSRIEDDGHKMCSFDCSGDEYQQTADGKVSRVNPRAPRPTRAEKTLAHAQQVLSVPLEGNPTAQASSSSQGAKTRQERCSFAGRPLLGPVCTPVNSFNDEAKNIVSGTFESVKQCLANPGPGIAMAQCALVGDPLDLVEGLKHVLKVCTQGEPGEIAGRCTAQLAAITATRGRGLGAAKAVDKGRRLASGKVAAFDNAGVEYTEHFATRIAQREARGISGQTALDAYNRGTRFYDPATRAHIRYDRQTGVAVVLRRGRAHTVFEQPRPSSRWNPVRYGGD